MELLIILIVALVVLGPERLPEVARGAGRLVHKLKVLTENLQEEMKDVVDDPSMGPIKEISEFAARPREKLAEYAAEAEAEARQAALEKQKEEAAARNDDEAASASPEIAELPEGYTADAAKFEAPPIASTDGLDLDSNVESEQPSHGFYEPDPPTSTEPETE